MARLFINKQTRKLSSDRQGRNPLSFDSLIPTAGAEMEIELFAVEATGPGTLTSPTITIASKDAPRGGTLSLSYDGTSLGEISVRAGAAEWEAYVNANTSISALGGMVVQIDDGRVLLVSRAAGVFADFAVVSSDLLPFGTAVLTQIQAGDANEREIWVLRTELGTIAVQNVFSQSSTVSATVTELISGGASAAEVQRIAISGEPVMGFWTITTASGMTLPLRWDVGPRHVEAAMNAKLGDGTVSVSQAAAFTFDVAWNAVGTQSPLTVGTGGLTGIQCSSATFTLDTAEAEAIPDWADAWVQITDSSEVIYSEQVTLRNLNLVGDQPVTQTAGVVRYDAAQTLTSGQQEQARTNISAAKSGAVTGSGLTMAGQRLLGRATGGVGALDEIQLGTGLALSGTYLSVLSSYGGQGAADGDMMVQFSADGSITATAGVHLTGDSGYVALYNDGALGVLFNPIDVNSHFGLLERKIALDQDTVWTLPNLSGTLMVGAANLGDLTDFGAARDTLGLGTADSPQFAGLQFSTDLFLRRAGAANLSHGGADSATPISQYDSVQNVSTGTSNTAGAARYFDGSQGTGTGAGGSIIFRTAAAGSSGTEQNVLTEHAKLFYEGGVRKFQIGSYQLHESEGLFATSGSMNLSRYGWYCNMDLLHVWSATTHHGTTRDLAIGRAAAGLIGLWGATNKTTGAGLHLPEMTAPAGYADAARIYAEDNGSGKTRLMVIFPSGAAQQIAIEP